MHPCDFERLHVKVVAGRDRSPDVSSLAGPRTHGPGHKLKFANDR